MANSLLALLVRKWIYGTAVVLASALGLAHDDKAFCPFALRLVPEEMLLGEGVHLPAGLPGESRREDEFCRLAIAQPFTESLDEPWIRESVDVPLGTYWNGAAYIQRCRVAAQSPVRTLHGQKEPKQHQRDVQRTSKRA